MAVMCNVTLSDTLFIVNLLFSYNFFIISALSQLPLWLGSSGYIAAADSDYDDYLLNCNNHSRETRTCLEYLLRIITATYIIVNFIL